MKRLTEYTVVSGRRTSWRRARSPTSTPSAVNDTMDGRRTRPSSSGITRGSPVFSSTYATRLFVVPRSMPMMRDMFVLGAAERRSQIIDDRAQIGTGRERRFERGESLRPVGRRGRVPRGAELADDARFFSHAARNEPLALRHERGARGVVESAGAALLDRFLDLEPFFQQLGRRLRL